MSLAILDAPATKSQFADSLSSVIPYQDPVIKEKGTDVSSTLSSVLPMAAMFTRNKMIGWFVCAQCSGQDVETDGCETGRP